MGVARMGSNPILFNLFDPFVFPMLGQGIDRAAVDQINCEAATLLCRPQYLSLSISFLILGVTRLNSYNAIMIDMLPKSLRQGHY